MAIISARRKISTIAEMVDLIYCRSVDSAYYMAFMANKRKQRDDQYKSVSSSLSTLSYGRNPFIYARQVSNLKVVRDEVHKIERVCWTEPPYLKIEKPGSMPIVVEPEIDKELVRSLDPLSLDIYER